MEQDYFSEMKRRKQLLDQRGAEYLRSNPGSYEDQLNGDGVFTDALREVLGEKITEILNVMSLGEGDRTPLQLWALEQSSLPFMGDANPNKVRNKIGFSQAACDARLLNLLQHLQNKSKPLNLPVVAHIDLDRKYKSDNMLGSRVTMIPEPKCYNELQFDEEFFGH